MLDRSGSSRVPDLRERIAAFLVERYPLVAPALLDRLDAALAAAPPSSPTSGNDSTPSDVVRLRLALDVALEHTDRASDLEALEVLPGCTAGERLGEGRRELAESLDGCLAREAIRASLSADEKREMLRGMVLTRATDNQLKAFFMGGQVRYQGTAFQGKGFRSLGQEAVYAAGVRLRRGAAYRDGDGTWRGDVVAPMIRDLGVALAMRPTGETVRMVLSAQMAKAGPPNDGRDFTIGDMDWGILPATAPLSIGTLSMAGLALAFKLTGSGQVAVTFIGEGGSSLGEWHEAINACAARRLPAVFCVQNNQTALSTPVADQSAVRVFADKAAGYGIPGLSVDGTDPEAIAAAFTWAVERAREGHGPALIELIAMRMCGHAHHDDMLYLGRDAPPGWRYPTLHAQGYADPDRFAFWSARDPLVTYAARLEADGIIDAGTLAEYQAEAEVLVAEQARLIVEAPWPDAGTVGVGVYADGPPAARVEVLTPARLAVDFAPGLPPVEPAPAFARDGRTYLEAVALGIGDALAADPRVFVYGQDVGGRYGNAFLLLRPLLAEFGDRILNSPLAEGAVVGVCVGAALAGMRPIGEIQFNDFVASGFNQLVNNAAKIRYRWGGGVPMVLRMPWGGLRHAGPYHSQNTEPWFYRTPGLKIVVPSTPADARALMAAALADPDPVLYYEHIALYRDPRIKQRLLDTPPDPLPIGRAALRRAGDDLAIVSYGAYVHVALRVADALAAEGIEAAVLDLRSLVPLDRGAVLRLTRHCNRVLIVHEDSRTGGIGESLAAIIQEEAFESLDAPVRIVGALDTPVPYAPSLEEAFLPGEAEIAQAARLLVAY
jgi:2-oxoisovalerate dehydrogenase E1 component